MYNIKDMYVCMCPYCKECKETKHFIFLKPNACASKVKKNSKKKRASTTTVDADYLYNIVVRYYL